MSKYSIWWFHTQLLFGIVMVAFSWGVQGATVLDDKFNKLEQSIDGIINAINQHDYAEAHLESLHLSQLSKSLEDPAITTVSSDNLGWYYYASNMHNHSMELVAAMKQEDGVTGIYLLATLMHHMGELQATIPYWLRSHLKRQLERLHQGIAERNSAMVRNAAEVIHIGSSKLRMSVTARSNAYRHTRWVSSAMTINQLGDQIIPLAEDEKWVEISGIAAEVEFLLQRWLDSFIDQPEGDR
jgi:hypothetical protein